MPRFHAGSISIGVLGGMIAGGLLTAATFPTQQLPTDPLLERTAHILSEARRCSNGGSDCYYGPSVKPPMLANAPRIDRLSDCSSHIDGLLLEKIESTFVGFVRCRSDGLLLEYAVTFAGPDNDETTSYAAVNATDPAPRLGDMGR